MKLETIGLRILIEGDINGLYKRLVRAETDRYLERLVKIPEEINNIFHLMATRELDENDFIKLKAAYRANESTTSVNQIYRRISYLTLLYQQFPYNSIFDENLRANILSRFTGIFAELYPNERPISVEATMRAFQDKGILKVRNDVKLFFTGLCSMEEVNISVDFNVITETLRDADHFVEFYEIVDDGLDRASLDGRLSLLEAAARSFPVEQLDQSGFNLPMEKSKVSRLLSDLLTHIPENPNRK